MAALKIVSGLRKSRVNGQSRQICVHTQSSATGTCQSETSQIAGPIRGRRRSTERQLQASLCTASSPLCLVPQSSCSLLVSCQWVVTYASPVEAFVTGIKMESSD